MVGVGCWGTDTIVQGCRALAVTYDVHRFVWKFGRMRCGCEAPDTNQQLPVGIVALPQAVEAQQERGVFAISLQAKERRWLAVAVERRA
jgi:hypothetical protein